MTTVLEQQLMDSIEIVKRDQLIKLLRHENGLLKLKIDMQRDSIANLQARLYNHRADFDADLPALLRPQA